MGLLDQPGNRIKDNVHFEEQEHFGSYQFTSLKDVIGQFMVAYVGDNKIIRSIKKADVAFHAQRGLQELSFDTLKSFKGLEQVVPASLQMKLPKDYVNYTKISWVDGSGIKHPIYPTNKTSNPSKFLSDSNDEFVFNRIGELIPDKNLISNGTFETSDGWTFPVFSSSSSNPAWIIGDIDITGAGVIFPTGFTGFKFNNVLQGVIDEIGYCQIDAPEVIEGRRYRITYDIVYPSDVASPGQLVLANHSTEISQLNSPSTTNNVNLINESVVGTHSVEWLQGPNNVGKIRLWNDASFAGLIDNIRVVRIGEGTLSTTLTNFNSTTPSENNNDDYEDNTYWSMDGNRYGLDPQYAQVNGSFFIDQAAGKIHFSSNISGKTVILDYISDSIGTDGEMQVHKFAEEALYKHIIHAVVSTSSWGQQLVPRLTKEKFAATRKAKLRLSNIKLEELTQILRGKSKQIKH